MPIPCDKANVRRCSAAAKEACLHFDLKTTADLIEITPQGFITRPGNMDFRVYYCGSLEDDRKPRVKCENAKNQIYNLSWTLDAMGIEDFEFKHIEEECSRLDICEGDCISEEHNPDNEGLVWWTILLIVILIIIIIVVIVVLYCMFLKKSAVAPKDVETPMYLEEVEDPRLVRLKEVERYLDDAIAYKDMADLKLTIDIVEQEDLKSDLKQKYDHAVELLDQLMAREAEAKRKELEEEERKAEEAKRALEEAEKEVLRRQKEEEEEALKKALKAQEEARARWARQWPRLQILRALNGINSELAAKALEEAKKAREEEERQRRLAEDNAKKVAYCKQLLNQGLAASDEKMLENAVKTTHFTVFQTTIIEEDKELKDLYDKAKEELDRIRKERERLEKEAEAKRKEEERIAEEKRKEEERIAEENRKEEQRLKEEKRLAALAKLEEIKLSLQTAIAEKDINKLKKSISDVEENNLVEDLADLHKQATALLERLQKIEKIKKNIQELKRPLIAELKSMASPPVDVHRSMTAAFLLMGENLKYLKEWNNIVILLNKTGRDSVKRRVQELKVQDVSEETANLAEEQIKGLTSDEVYEANQAASLFFDWSEMICFERKQTD